MAGQADPRLAISVSGRPKPEVPFRAPYDVAARLSAIGRTEDVIVSPDGRRLAIAVFNANAVALVDFTVESASDGVGQTVVDLSGVTIVRCDALAKPHGLAFVDNTTMLVANRESELLLLQLPRIGDSRCDVLVDGRVLVDGSGPVPVSTPGSIAVRRSGGGLCEAVVCNNYAHTVTRYVFDLDDQCRMIDRDVVVSTGLDIPDGVAISASGRWMAISNHSTHEVFVYAYGADVDPETPPVGVLQGANYPHGLRFADDDRYLVLADAGLPFVYAFCAPDGDWSGRRSPTNTLRVMDDASFNAGRYNPQEGGPKGIEVVAASRLVVVTSEHQGLGFFEFADVIGPDRVTRLPTSEALIDAGKLSVERSTVLRSLRRLEAASEALAQTRHDHAEVTEQLQTTQVQRDHGLAELQAAHDRCVGLRTEVAHVSVELERRESELGRLQAELVTTHELLAESGRQTGQLGQEISLFYDSTSWRITSPARRIATVVKRLRRTRRG